ncbi:hypothetical protein HDV03_003563 [Kappamyces sp. JEL0829]|nr:hypothetical protein HDV03_003563 [Kappamyces sp. JEL0829]
MNREHKGSMGLKDAGELSLDSLNTLKWASFTLLICQASGHAIVAKYSRSVPGPKYLASTVVVCCELLKLGVCLLAHYRYRQRLPSQSFLKLLYYDVFGPESDWVAMSVPAICYFIQNMLLFVAMTYLDPATYQITSQLKILTTAVFSVLLLGTKLSPTKWGTLVMIVVGVILVQMQGTSGHEARNSLTGFLAVILRCTLSGFAGIWFEKALKGNKGSIWLRNIQLSLFSLVPGIIVACGMIDGQAILEDGFFQGYTAWTWAAVFFESLGGLVVAFVVKYADSILKVIATTIAFILSSGASIYIFNLAVGPFFLLGSVIVLAASQIYILGMPTALMIQQFLGIGHHSKYSKL